MDEEKKESKKVEKKKENLELIERSEEIAKKLEEGNQKAEEIVRQQEELFANMQLHGKGIAGQTKGEEDDGKITPEKINKDLEKIGW